jgi:hypothetical protein
LEINITALNSSSPTVWEMIAAFVPGSIVVFSVLPRWNGVSKLSFSKKVLDLQNKYLITDINNNNNKKINKT